MKALVGALSHMAVYIRWPCQKWLYFKAIHWLIGPMHECEKKDGFNAWVHIRYLVSEHRVIVFSLPMSNMLWCDFKIVEKRNMKIRLMLVSSLTNIGLGLLTWVYIVGTNLNVIAFKLVQWSRMFFFSLHSFFGWI